MRWTRAVRAELARQALELRAHSWGDSESVSLDGATQAVMHGYIWLGQHPLRLPGEDA